MGGVGRKQDKEDRASEHEVHLIKPAQWGASEQSSLIAKTGQNGHNLGTAKKAHGRG